MTARVLIINPSGEEDRGVLDEVLQEANAEVEELATQDAVKLLDPGSPSKTARIVSSLPQTSEGRDCLILLGSPLGVKTDPLEGSSESPAQLTKEMERLVRDFHECGKPVLGLCLGAQVISRTFGGKVYPLPKDSAHTALPYLDKPQPAAGMEFGFQSQEFTPAAEADAVVGPALKALRCAGPNGQASVVPKFMQWHSDTYDFPQGAVQLSTSPSCPNQAFRLGINTYGFQYHIEVGRELAQDWYTEYAEGTATHASCGSEEPEQVDQEAAKAHLASVMAEGAVDGAEAFTKSVMKSLLEQALLVRDSKAGTLSRCPSPAVLAAVAAVAAIAAAIFYQKLR